MSQAWLHSFVLPFVLQLCLCYRVNQAISISTRSIRKQSMTSSLGLAKTKQREFYFVSAFVLHLAYAWTMILCLCLWRSLCRLDWWLDFIPLFCLLFVLMLMLLCEPGFTIIIFAIITIFFLSPFSIQHYWDCLKKCQKLRNWRR